MNQQASAQDVAATRFRKLADVRREGDRVQLRYGDLRDLAAATGRTVGTLSRVIAGEREPAPELRSRIEDLAGVPIERIDLPRRAREPVAA